MSKAIAGEQAAPALRPGSVARAPGSGARIRQAFRASPFALVGAGFLICLILLALAAPVVGRYSPTESILTDFEQPPSARHWLGTDSAGFDVWSRLIWGARNSLFIGVVAVTIATVIGTLVGALGGFYGGLLDSLLMRLTDAFLAFPSIVLILMLAATLGPSITNVVIVLGGLSWMSVARLVRGQFLSLREQDWILAARAVGVSNGRLIGRHLLPHVLSPVVIAATFGVAGATLAEASLSFLGLGVRPPTPSWGSMLSGAQSIHILREVPWSWLAPGLVLTLVVLAVNAIGETLRQGLDPRSRR
jgi:peptide/nickel transport system permease protein